MAPVTRQTDRRQQMFDRIQATAYALMRQHGTAGLSVRAITRELDLSAMAFYRYYENIDALITDLIVDSFDALGDALARAVRASHTASMSERIMTVSKAYRQWAIDHPVRFQLIYGNPIPNYEAPAEITAPASARSMTAFLEVLAEGLASGAIVPPASYAVPASFAENFVYLSARHGYPASHMSILYLGSLGWSRLHGLIMLELFNHLQPVVGDVASHYEQEVRRMSREMGLRESG